jgi:hypothetical protein
MPDFRHVISQAYTRILLRPPDPGGLETYNQAMNAGLSEAQLRESLLRSPEYATRFPEPGAKRSARRKPARAAKRVAGARTARAEKHARGAKAGRRGR